jgi:hypothetical protein
MAKRKSTNNDLQNTHKTKDEQHEPTKNRGELKVLRKGKHFLLYLWQPSCSSSYKPSNKSGEKDREVLTTSGTYPWSFVTQIFRNS